MLGKDGVMQPEPVTTSTPLGEPSLLEADAVATRLAVDPETGLSEEEAVARLSRFGRNELRAQPPVPVWRKILAQFQDPLIYLLLAAVAVSVVAWALQGADGVPVDALVIAAIVVLNAALGFTQEVKAEDAVAVLGTMTAARSTVLRGGLLQAIPSAELTIGDVLVLSEGDAVGADARLLSASAVQVQEASLTGESAPVRKDPSRLPEPVPLGDRRNMVYKGTAVAQGVGRAVVTGVGMATEVGSIAEMLDATVEEPTPLQNEINRISKFLGILVIVTSHSWSWPRSCSSTK